MNANVLYYTAQTNSRAVKRVDCLVGGTVWNFWAGSRARLVGVPWAPVRGARGRGGPLLHGVPVLQQHSEFRQDRAVLRSQLDGDGKLLTRSPTLSSTIFGHSDSQFVTHNYQLYRERCFSGARLPLCPACGMPPQTIFPRRK